MRKSLKLNVAIFFVLIPLLNGCATYQYANKVRMLSFDDDVSKGESIGPIRGEDCAWTILGYRLGTPKLQKAVASARRNSGETIRYINNASSQTDGFNAAIVKKDCIIIKGVGYK